MAVLPRMREPNARNELVFRRARSVDTMRSQEELDGIERQNVKITKYAHNNIKKHKQSNGKAIPIDTLQTTNKELIKLRSVDVEQKASIKRLRENHEILEKQLLSKEELVDYCKKIADDEWDKKTSLLLDQVLREYLPLIESTVREKLRQQFISRKQAIDKGMSELVSSLASSDE